MFSTATTPPALRAYRERHAIDPVRDWQDDFRTYVLVCRHDAIRVYERKGGYVHDPSEIKQLVRFENGEKIDWTIR